MENKVKRTVNTDLPGSNAYLKPFHRSTNLVLFCVLFLFSFLMDDLIFLSLTFFYYQEVPFSFCVLFFMYNLRDCYFLRLNYMRLFDAMIN